MHQDYLYQSGITIGCEGPGLGVLRTSPGGERRSRDGARLQNVLADAQQWHDAYQHEAAGWSQERQAGEDPLFILLENPTRSQVTDAIVECGEFLSQFKNRPNWNGGSFFFAFSGHGTEEGNLVLADGEFSPDELIELIAAPIKPTPPQRRRLGLVFDSCFSGLTLARIMVHKLHHDRVSIPDGFAAALHDESAWELDSLGHGALTFTMRNSGNAHVDWNRLAEAVERSDEAYLRLALQGFVPNPVTYLTEGDQHSLDLINGHSLEIKGWGGISVLGDVSLDQLLDALEQIRSHPAPGHRVQIGK